MCLVRLVTAHTYTHTHTVRTIVVGGGPAGLLAGLASIELGAKDVTLLEMRREFTRRNMLIVRSSGYDRKNWLGQVIGDSHGFKAEFHDLRPNLKSNTVLHKHEINTDRDRMFCLSLSRYS